MEEHNFKSNIITRRIYLKETIGKGMGVYAAEDKSRSTNRKMLPIRNRHAN